MSTPATLGPGSRRDRTARLSEEILGLRWERFVPRAIGAGGAVLELADYEEASGFLARQRRLLLGAPAEPGGFSLLVDDPRKTRFCERVADCFVLRIQGETVGALLGHLSDWSTYYVRYLAVLPDRRGQGITPDLAAWFVSVLSQHGVERMEIDAGVSHLPYLSRLIGLGFHVMGTLHSERWGATVRLVRFLSARHEEAFVNQFSAGLRFRVTKEGGD
jgi:GNAT superfamily N-acetyltransferase